MEEKTMIIKKRQLLLATLIIALAAAVFVNWYYTRPEVETAGAGKGETTTKQDAEQGINLGDARYVLSTDASLEDAAAQAKASESECDIPQEILELAEQRKAARKEKNFALADQLRDKITALGYVITETRQGTEIKKL